MAQDPRISGRILAFFAHPDDELSVGGTLARYAAQGVGITLVCATRGEAATIYSPPEYGATRENLAQVRTAELECCCRHLGISDLRWLDWPDGCVQELDRDQAVAQVVAIIRDVRPQVMITHPSHGGYPHPDHIAIHQIGLTAWETAADPNYRPDLGPAHAVAKLYGRVIPLSFFEVAPGFREYRVQLNGQQLPFHGTPEEEISTVIDVADWVEQRIAGWECHRSQHNPNGAFSQMPDEVRQQYLRREYLQVIAHRLSSAPTREDDLFAGLSETQEPVPAVKRPAAETTDQAPAISAQLTSRLIAALRMARTYLQVYRQYRQRAAKPDLAALLDQLIEDTQEVVADLSRLIRLAGASPLAAGVNEKVVRQAMVRKGTVSKLNFLLVGCARTEEWLKSQELPDSPADVQALWQELIAMTARHTRTIKRFLAQIELAT